jgi:hypothetical protein
MKVELLKNQIEWIMWEIQSICDTHSIEEDIFTFKKSDYDEISQEELNTMKGIKDRLEKVLDKYIVG